MSNENLYSGMLSWIRSHKPDASDTAATQTPEPQRVAPDDEHYDEIAKRLRAAEQSLIERGATLYELQQHYSSEHFALQESLRNLKIERMRNAGAYAQLEWTMGRARALQSRIADLKNRLRRHEPVEDEDFDHAPIVVEHSAVWRDD